jgi:hypothetical protein
LLTTPSQKCMVQHPPCLPSATAHVQKPTHAAVWLLDASQLENAQHLHIQTSTKLWHTRLCSQSSLQQDAQKPDHLALRAAGCVHACILLSELEYLEAAPAAHVCSCHLAVLLALQPGRHCVGCCSGPTCPLRSSIQLRDGDQGSGTGLELGIQPRPQAELQGVGGTRAEGHDILPAHQISPVAV